MRVLQSSGGYFSSTDSRWRKIAETRIVYGWDDVAGRRGKWRRRSDELHRGTVRQVPRMSALLANLPPAEDARLSAHVLRRLLGDAL